MMTSPIHCDSENDSNSGGILLLEEAQRAPAFLNLTADFDVSEPVQQQIVASDSDDEVVILGEKHPTYDEITLEEDEHGEVLETIVTYEKAQTQPQPKNSLKNILHECPNCDNSFHDESFLKFHIKTQHLTDQDTFVTTAGISDSTPHPSSHKANDHQLKEDFLYECSKCYKIFGSKSQLERHIEKQHSVNKDTFADNSKVSDSSSHSSPEYENDSQLTTVPDCDNPSTLPQEKDQLTVIYDSDHLSATPVYESDYQSATPVYENDHSFSPENEYKPTTPIYASDYHSTTPIYESDNNCSTFMYKNNYYSTTPIYESDNHSTTPTSECDNFPPTPVYTSDHQSKTPVHENDHQSTTPIYESDHQSTTPIYESDHQSTTPIYESDHVFSSPVYESYYRSNHDFDNQLGQSSNANYYDKKSSPLCDNEHQFSHMYDSNKKSTPIYVSDHQLTPIYENDHSSGPMYENERLSNELYLEDYEFMRKHTCHCSKKLANCKHSNDYCLSPSHGKSHSVIKKSKKKRRHSSAKTESGIKKKLKRSHKHKVKKEKHKSHKRRKHKSFPKST